MTKPAVISKPVLISSATAAATTAVTSPTSPDNSVNGERKKRSNIIPRLFKRSGRDEDGLQLDGSANDSERGIRSRKKIFLEASPAAMKKSFSESQNIGIEGLNLSNYEHSRAPGTVIQDFRIFVGTWNVGGNAPHQGLNLEEFLQVESSPDMYVLGFQEIVPLSAGNVLVVEDSEPAAKWLAIINEAINKPIGEDFICHSPDSSGSSKYSNNSKDHSKSNFFHKPSLKVLTRNLRADNGLVKACNCHLGAQIYSNRQRRPRTRKLVDPGAFPLVRCDPGASGFLSMAKMPAAVNATRYRLIASKQMVGIFLSVWARDELVRHMGHLRISTVGTGIMGRLGNKGCISISLSLHETNFCFVCSHLASGEKEGDELRRNANVAEILKSTQFQNTCKNPNKKRPETIIDHDRIIWMGDLNYRVSLSYEETRLLLENNEWDYLLDKDQLNMEREAGRVFSGWCEGRITFAPTYKYSQNSDSYAGETVKSKRKRRTPAWCDRILWRGKGIEQLSYLRGESRFSDHRPVCAAFAMEVEVISKSSRFRKGYPCTTRLDSEDCIPHSHSFYEF